MKECMKKESMENEKTTKNVWFGRNIAKTIWCTISQKDKFKILFGIGIALLLFVFSDKLSQQKGTENELLLSDRMTYDETKNIKNTAQEGVSGSDDMEIEHYQDKMEERVTQVLSEMDGVGKVSVMMTFASGTEQVVEKDEVMEQSGESIQDGEGGIQTTEQMNKQEQTLTYQNENGQEVPFVTSQKMPKIEGIMIVCDGGDRVEVVLQITSAMEALFGLEPHKIVVVKRNAG